MKFFMDRRFIGYAYVEMMWWAHNKRVEAFLLKLILSLCKINKNLNKLMWRVLWSHAVPTIRQGSVICLWSKRKPEDLEENIESEGLQKDNTFYAWKW